MPLILASTSPRRRELLALLGIPFDVKRPSFEERLVVARPAIEQVQASVWWALSRLGGVPSSGASRLFASDQATQDGSVMC